MGASIAIQALKKIGMEVMKETVKHIISESLSYVIHSEISKNTLSSIEGKDLEKRRLELEKKLEELINDEGTMWVAPAGTACLYAIWKTYDANLLVGKTATQKVDCIAKLLQLTEKHIKDETPYRITISASNAVGTSVLIPGGLGILLSAEMSSKPELWFVFPGFYDRYSEALEKLNAWHH